jgi:hypothetical protein
MSDKEEWKALLRKFEMEKGKNGWPDLSPIEQAIEARRQAALQENRAPDASRSDQEAVKPPTDE